MWQLAARSSFSSQIVQPEDHHLIAYMGLTARPQGHISGTAKPRADLYKSPTPSHTPSGAHNAVLTVFGKFCQLSRTQCSKTGGPRPTNECSESSQIRRRSTNNRALQATVMGLTGIAMCARAATKDPSAPTIPLQSIILHHRHCKPPGSYLELLTLLVANLALAEIFLQKIQSKMY